MEMHVALVFNEGMGLNPTSDINAAASKTFNVPQPHHTCAHGNKLDLIT